MRLPDSWRPLALLLLLAADPAAGAAAANPLPLRPGEVTEFTVVLTPELRRLTGPAGVTEAHCAVAVPPGFAADRPWPVLLVSATSDPGYNSSRALLRQFAPPALRAGWIVVAADPPQAVSVAQDTDGLRLALLIGAMARLQEDWPGLVRWPRAFGGFSGGAKRSASLAALWRTISSQAPIGVFQAGCNQPVMQSVLALPGLPRDAFLGTPVFLSSGRDDPIAPPPVMRDVAADLRRAGFRQVRFERFNGGHEVHADHVEEALRWFAGLAAAGPPAGAP